MVSKDTLFGSITYIYDAEGNKLQKQVLENQQLHTTDYLGGFQYLDGKLDFIPHAEGYVKAVHTGNTTEFHYVYNYTDHLGNIRLSYGRDPETNEVAILKESHYYPFGMQHNGYVGNHRVFEPIQGGRVNLVPVRNYLDDSYRYDFNAKEHQPELGLNWHDYHARNYDAALGRWMNVDPLAEEYPEWSSYNYVMNNPIRFIDPDGRDVWEINRNGEIVNRIEDETQDAFHRVDDKGNKLEGKENSIVFDYGTVKERNHRVKVKGGGEKTMKIFEINGDGNTVDVFSFAIGGNGEEQIEWGLVRIGKDKSERNLLGTINEKSNSIMSGYALAYDYTIRESNHNHPSSTIHPSEADVNTAKKISDKFKDATFNIYVSCVQPISAKHFSCRTSIGFL